MTDEEKDTRRGFTVQDRRRFSESGEARPEVADRPEPTAPATGSEAASTATGAATEMNFSTFVISLITQALAHLGEIPDPVTQASATDLDGARQLIDILGILKEKTKGNLDNAESGLLDAALYDLRMRYVERARAQHTGT